MIAWKLMLTDDVSSRNCCQCKRVQSWVNKWLQFRSKAPGSFESEPAPSSLVECSAQVCISVMSLLIKKRERERKNATERLKHITLIWRANCVPLKHIAPWKLVPCGRKSACVFFANACVHPCGWFKAPVLNIIIIIVADVVPFFFLVVVAAAVNQVSLFGLLVTYYLPTQSKKRLQSYDGCYVASVQGPSALVGDGDGGVGRDAL